jgi:hypothetical protein
VSIPPGARLFTDLIDPKLEGVRVEYAGVHAEDRPSIRLGGLVAWILRMRRYGRHP